jgi:hypothetical protein
MAGLLACSDRHGLEAVQPALGQVGVERQAGVPADQQHRHHQRARKQELRVLPVEPDNAPPNRYVNNSVMTKLRARDRAKLVVIAYQSGMVSARRG